MNNIGAKWFEDISQGDEAAKAQRLELVQNSPVLDILGDIIKREMDRLSRSPESEYNNPNWSFREADRNGQYRTLQLIYSLTKRK